MQKIWIDLELMSVNTFFFFNGVRVEVENDKEYKESRSQKTKPLHLKYWLRTFNHSRM